jgi:hypothetical protein
VSSLEANAAYEAAVKRSNELLAEHLRSADAVQASILKAAAVRGSS